MVRSDQRWSM